MSFTMEEMVCTDMDRNQYGQQITDDHFQFMELRDGEWTEMDIFLSHYTDEQILNHISAYYSSLEELREIYDDQSNWIIAECIFEQESGLY